MPRQKLPFRAQAMNSNSLPRQRPAAAAGEPGCHSPNQPTDSISNTRMLFQFPVRCIEKWGLTFCVNTIMFLLP